jgi:hypothetical protein
MLDAIILVFIRPLRIAQPAFPLFLKEVGIGGKERLKGGN